MKNETECKHKWIKIADNPLTPAYISWGCKKSETFECKKCGFLQNRFIWLNLEKKENKNE